MKGVRVCHSPYVYAPLREDLGESQEALKVALGTEWHVGEELREQWVSGIGGELAARLGGTVVLFFRDIHDF